MINFRICHNCGLRPPNCWYTRGNVRHQIQIRTRMIHICIPPLFHLLLFLSYTLKIEFRGLTTHQYDLIIIVIVRCCINEYGVAAATHVLLEVVIDTHADLHVTIITVSSHSVHLLRSLNLSDKGTGYPVLIDLPCTLACPHPKRRHLAYHLYGITM